MAAEVRVEPLLASQLDELLPLIAAYQRFYGIERVDADRNREFFARFLPPSQDGMLLCAWRGGELLGYACLLWSFTSLVPAETVLMNDLYVVASARGEGVGRALIEASAGVARERGAHQLEWVTAPGNRRARRLYDSTGAECEEWVGYELDL
jgi:GNAT superfamily N-acetyltransferase